MRSYLLDIAEHFQRLARDAFNGYYNDTFFGGLRQEDWKLRAQLRKLNQTFEDTMLTWGSAYKIRFDRYSEVDDSEEAHAFPQYLQPFDNLYKDAFPVPKEMDEKSLMAWIDQLASRNRGKELPGTPNGELAQ